MYTVLLYSFVTQFFHVTFFELQFTYYKIHPFFFLTILTTLSVQACSLYSHLYSRSPELFCLTKLKLNPLNINYPSPLAWFYFNLNEFDYFEYLIWLMSFNSVLRVLLCCRIWQDLFQLLGCIIFHFMDIPHFVYPFISKRGIASISWLLWIMMSTHYCVIYYTIRYCENISLRPCF